MIKKETFILKTSYKAVIDKLSDKQAGVLFKMLLEYVANGANAGTPDERVDMAFEFVKMDLNVFADKYEKRKLINAGNGRNGGAPSGNKNASKNNQKQPKTTKNNQNNQNNPNDNDNENENENEEKKKEKEKIPPAAAAAEFFVKTGNLSAYMLANSLWFEAYCMNNHMKPPELKALIDGFVKHLEDGNVVEKGKNDIFTHFANWVRARKNSINEKAGELPARTVAKF